MAKYLLDTNIYITKHHPPEVLTKFESLQVGDVAISLITYGELNFGAEKSRQPIETHAKLNRLAELINVLPLSTSVASCYGKIRSRLEQAGTPIGANDLWIAAHALVEDLILVSNNLREFRRVPGLRVENWVKKQ